jgi:hypothetical protein
MAVRIICITKDRGNHNNPHEGITFYGWLNEATGERGKTGRADMIKFLEVQGGSAYVKDLRGNMAYVGVYVTSWGTKYLRTYADKIWTDNLLSLRGCD